jgi:DNA-binding HxlR family transcriptional regulator
MCSRLLVMATLRTYGDGCGIAHALDLVGERWALLVVRELLLGPKRFTDLRDGLPKTSPNVLAQRLRELEEAGILRRRKLPPPAGSSIYELTDWGRELKPIVLTLGTWALRSPSCPADAPVGIDSVVLALGTFFDAEAAGDLTARYELRLGENAFDIRVADGAIEVDRGAADDPDAIIETDATTLSALIWERRELADALRAGHLTIEGDEGAVTRFLELFPRPLPAVPAA